ncbi:MAG: hypothetical protein ACOWYE_10430 [Desulfatiglandales bacterium]
MNFMKLETERRRPVLFLFLFSAFTFFYGCAALRPVPEGPPLTSQQVGAILSEMALQQARVSSFYSQGKVVMKDGLLEAESDILIVGNREPLRIRVEFTHPWGKPLLHVLIDDMRLNVLSFRDKKCYSGAFSPDALSGFFPGGLERSMIWAVLRGYPDLFAYNHILSSEANRILVLDERGVEIQRVTISEKHGIPEKVDLMRQGVQLAFWDYRSEGGVLYARRERITHPESNKTLSLQRTTTVFNKPIPAELFLLEKPPHFEQADLEDIR